MSASRTGGDGAWVVRLGRRADHSETNPADVVLRTDAERSKGVGRNGRVDAIGQIAAAMRKVCKTR